MRKNIDELFGAMHVLIEPRMTVFIRHCQDAVITLLAELEGWQAETELISTTDNVAICARRLFKTLAMIKPINLITNP